MSKWTYIYARVDERTWEVFFQGRDIKGHLAGRIDPSQNWDRYLFTSALEALGAEDGTRFKEEFTKVLHFMAAMNKMGETTKEGFRPFLTIFARDEQAGE